MKLKLGELRSQTLGYAVAPLAVLAALELNRWLWPHTESASTSLFFAAVMVSAWYGGLKPGLFASFLTIFAYDYFLVAPFHSLEFSAANLVRVGVFLWVAMLISLLNGIRKRLNDELQEALAQVKLLSGLLPICASCKNIRDGEGRWNQIETYISNHSEAVFTHGMCPECFKKHYPESYDKYKKLYLEVNT